LFISYKGFQVWGASEGGNLPRSARLSTKRIRQVSGKKFREELRKIYRMCQYYAVG